MRFDLAIEGNLRAHLEGREAVLRGGLYKAAGLAAGVVKDRYRAAIVGAGLGERLGRTVRGVVYPRKGTRTLEPSAFVYTKAPELIRVFAHGATIRPVKGGVYLWIPTENVPGFGNRKTLSPTEVEDRFGDFEYVPSLTRPGVVLATVQGILAKNKSGWRKASAGRKKQGRNAVRIVMFILVRQVRLKKRIDFDRLVADATAAWPDIVARSLAEAFRNEQEPAR